MLQLVIAPLVALAVHCRLAQMESLAVMEAMAVGRLIQ
jgi:hypothetical protein